MNLITSWAGFVGSNSARRLAQSLTKNHEIYVPDALICSGNLTKLGPVSDLGKIHFIPVTIRNSVAVGTFMATIAKVLRNSPTVAFEIGLKETKKGYLQIKHLWEPRLTNDAAKK